MKRAFLLALALASLVAAPGLAADDPSPVVPPVAPPVPSPVPSPARADPPSDPPPNLVYVVADDLDVASMASLPELRPLLQDAGMTFTNAYVSLSLCCPSRSTMLRGQYAHNTGVFWNKGRFGGYDRFRDTGDEASTLATWLHDAGYETALMGKYLNGYPDRDEPRAIPPGWSTWVAPSGGDPYGEFKYRLNVDGRVEWRGGRDEDYLTDVLAEHAAAFIDRAAGESRPFFLYVAPFAPHAPETPAPRHAGLFLDAHAPRGPAFDEADVSDKPPWLRAAPPIDAAHIADADTRWRRRLQSMEGVVDLLRTLLTRLQADGVLDRTWIVFTSDNGFHFAEHRLHPGKNSAYDEDLRVPLIVRGPGVPAGATDDHLVVNTDYAPTFAALAGVTPPIAVDGRSLVPLLLQEGPTPWRTAFLMEHRAPMDAPFHRKVEEPDDPDAHNGFPPFVGVHTADRVYVEYQDGERELYELRTDPAELDNLANRTDAGTLAALHAWVEALRTCAGETCREAEDAAPDP
jgi:arylsulfatase A-like enzyme